MSLPEQTPEQRAGQTAERAKARSVAALASTPENTEVLEWFRRQRAWINDQHAALCRIPAPTFFEQKRAEWMKEQFTLLGWPAEIDRAGNVVAMREEHRQFANGPVVAVTAHLDTVLAPRTADDIRMLGEGRLSGPGVSDNGAGLTALLALAAAWPKEDGHLAAIPMLVANVGEEGEGNLSGIRYLCRPGNNIDFRAFLVLDGPGVDHVTYRALASRRFEIVMNGTGGHSWRDSENCNAVHALSRAVTLFTDAFHARKCRFEEDGIRAAVNFGIIEGGSSINSIPAEARAKLDLRSENPAVMDELAALLAQSVEEAAAIENARKSGAPVNAKLREIGSRPGGEIARDAPLLASLRAVDQFLGIRSRLDCSSTDANIPLSLGLPAVSIGVGGQGGGAHTAGEWYGPVGRELGLRRVFLTLSMLLRGELSR